MTVDLNQFYETFPIIKLKSVTLREIVDRDADLFFKYINHPSVKTYLSDDDTPATIERAREELGYWGKLFRYRHCVYWGIADNETDELIGTCGYNNWSLCHRRCEISYDINYKYWGRGIMTEVIGAVCDFAFEKMQVNRVQATVVQENIGSIRVLEKNHFSREATLNEFCIVHGKTHDSYMYSLLRKNTKFEDI